MKLNKEYLRKLIVEQLEEADVTKFMSGGYPGFSKDDSGKLISHAGPKPRFTQSVHDIKGAANNLRSEIASVIKVYVKDEEAKNKALAKVKEYAELLDSVADYLGDSMANSAGYPETVN